MTSPEAAAPTPLPTGLVGYAPEFDREIEQFLAEAYPDRNPVTRFQRWRWMFLESAARLNVPPMVWMFRKAQGIVAHQGALSVRVQVAGQEFTTGWFVETFVLEKFRKGPVGTGVIAKARQDLPFNLSLGQTEQMRAIQLRSGWKQVADFQTMMLILRPSHVFSQKFGNVVTRWGAIAAMKLIESFKHWRGQPRSADPVVRQIENFGEPHDQLWKDVAPFYQTAVVRDAGHLQWKYVSQPGQDFTRLELSRNGRAFAVLILKTEPPGSAYNYRRMFLVDFVVDPSKPENVRWVFEAARREAILQQADSLTLYLIHPELTRLAVQYGFMKRTPQRFLLISADGVPEDVQKAAFDPNAWLVTQGDSDIDRP